MSFANALQVRIYRHQQLISPRTLEADKEYERGVIEMLGTRWWSASALATALQSCRATTLRGSRSGTAQTTKTIVFKGLPL